MSSPIAFALQFLGDAVEIGEGRYWAESRAPGPVVCRRQLDVADNGTLCETGEISFGDESSLTFRSTGELVAGPDPHTRHGTAECEVTGGRGRLAGARGTIACNFVLSESGHLTDHHLGLLFVEHPETEGGSDAPPTTP